MLAGDVCCCINKVVFSHLCSVWQTVPEEGTHWSRTTSSKSHCRLKRRRPHAAHFTCQRECVVQWQGAGVWTLCVECVVKLQETSARAAACFSFLFLLLVGFVTQSPEAICFGGVGCTCCSCRHWSHYAYRAVLSQQQHFFSNSSGCSLGLSRCQLHLVRDLTSAALVSLAVKMLQVLRVKRQQVKAYVFVPRVSVFILFPLYIMQMHKFVRLKCILFCQNACFLWNQELQH